MSLTPQNDAEWMASQRAIADARVPEPKETYPLKFAGDGLVMRLRCVAADECHDDAWLSAVITQAADEIERLSALVKQLPT